jgi:hypothetical protein
MKVILIIKTRVKVPIFGWVSGDNFSDYYVAGSYIEVLYYHFDRWIIYSYIIWMSYRD